MSTCVLFIDSACLFQYFCHCIVRDKSFFIRGVEGGGGGREVAGTFRGGGQTCFGDLGDGGGNK